MRTADSCTVAVLHRDGVAVQMVAWGSERDWPRSAEPKRCGDCRVMTGGFHHLGCDIQECPRCGHQMITCGCRYDEDSPLERDEDEDEDEEELLTPP